MQDFSTEVSQDEKSWYMQQFSQALSARMLAHSGDGIVVGFKERDGSLETKTIECQYKGEKHYFLFESDTFYLLPESKKDDIKAVVAFQTTESTALTALMQLITNPWIDPPFDIANFI
jgi:hypothetical protein